MPGLNHIERVNTKKIYIYYMGMKMVLSCEQLTSALRTFI